VQDILHNFEARWQKQASDKVAFFRKICLASRTCTQNLLKSYGYPKLDQSTKCNGDRGLLYPELKFSPGNGQRTQPSTEVKLYLSPYIYLFSVYCKTDLCYLPFVCLN
jgi:hypothetical protein